MKHTAIGRKPANPLTIPDPNRDHIQGSPAATITLLEYGDYECPYCGEAHAIVKQIIDRLGDDLCFAFRNFPLTNIHPHSEHAAEAAEAAGAQGQFWEMHDLIYENQAALEDEDLAQYAASLGLDVPRLMNEVLEGAHAARVRDDFTRGVRAGVNGTPSFFINGDRYDGAKGLEPLFAAIQAAEE
jgi:protein-disulfide isomerase